jgi:hypothetical protein
MNWLFGGSIAIFIVLLLPIGAWILLEPSHDRTWRESFSVLPSVSFSGDSVTVRNIRNWSYSRDGDALERAYLDATMQRETIDRMYFVLEPFGTYDGIAHTMIAFTLSDGTGYVVSIEARREVGETYHALKAAVWPTYEYMYVWATERDMYANSKYVTEDELYWYELNLTQEQKWSVVRALAKETNRLETQPRWYNTLFANCTNVLARKLNEHTRSSLPWDISWVLPGYSAEYLYAQGLFQGDDLSALKRNGYVTPHIDRAYGEPTPHAFSLKLRAIVSD